MKTIALQQQGRLVAVEKDDGQRIYEFDRFRV